MAIDFADFTLDPATRRLLRTGREVHLSPKAFDLLSLLIEHRTRAVAKTDLQAWLWPSTFVLESNLAGLVAEVRSALADSAAAPRFIRTVPRFGYWFIGPVTPGATPAQIGSRSVRCWLAWDGQQSALQAGDNVIGRAEDATIWVGVPGVSRRHAVIRLIDGIASVEDLGSKNGTFVGTERVTTPRVLTDGDRLLLGSFVMTFCRPATADQTASIEQA